MPALPKTRSGTILRRTIRTLVEVRDEPVPPTIENPDALAAFRRCRDSGRRLPAVRGLSAVERLRQPFR
ncbi:hypothetical protein [Plantactinospora sp. GCM10030261]|uniref:hypothetical protein n=1 Tax=Plantactinospora sp. GCM10030261 TaxID=3273420 RepID=UPI00360DF574